MRAVLSNHRQSPRKTRLVADLIRGKKVTDALAQLSFLNKRAAGPFRKVLLSAVANAKENNQKTKDELFIKSIQVDKGVTLKRHRPVSRGRAHPINRRRSHIEIVLSEKIGESVKKEETPKKKTAVKKETTKKEAKISKKEVKKVEKKPARQSKSGAVAKKKISKKNVT